MQNLPLIDLSIVFIYLFGMIGIGYYFSKKNKNTEQFTSASGKIPGWAIGISISTIIVGAILLIVRLSMIGIKSILDVWWELSGIFAGGMVGLFLLGLISKQTKNTEALIAVIVGLIVIIWFSFSDKPGPDLSYLKIALHKNMIIVVGTLTIFLTGILVTKIKQFINKNNQ